MTTKYVRITGSNSNNGSTPSLAYLTVAYAVTTAAPAAGDIIYVGAGSYRAVLAPSHSGSQLSTTYNGTNGSSLVTLGSVITLTSVSGLVAPPAGYYNTGSVVTSSGVVGFTWTGISGSTLTGVTFLTNITVASTATVASSATLLANTAIWIIGDVDGSQTGDAGQVISTGYTTNDKTVPSSTAQLVFSTNKHLAFALFTFISGASGGMITNAAGGIGYTFIDCTFNHLASSSYTNGTMAFISSTTGLAMFIMIDRCSVFHGINQNYGIQFTLTTTASGSADWDALVLIRDTFDLAPVTYSGQIGVIAGGTAAHHGGGVRVSSSHLFSGQGGGFYAVTATYLSTTIPCEIHNSWGWTGGEYALSAATSGQIVESYNWLWGGSTATRLNVTAGTGSIADGSYAPLVELGQSYKWAGVIRQFFAPDAPSPLLGFGSDGNSPTVDWMNRPRPSGGGSSNNAAGFAEFHDFSVESTTTYPSGQTASAEMTGPGDTDIWVPVDATATVITLQLYQGAGYTGTNYATATLLAQNELGVSAQIETCSSTTGSWQTLTFGSFTPTKAGYVKIRVTSYDTSGTGTLFFGALT